MSAQHSTSLLSDLACMLLSNITMNPAAAVALVSLEINILPLGSGTKFYPVQSRCATAPPPTPYPTGSTQKHRALSLLVDAFASSATISTENSERKGQLHFLASVFANISGVSSHSWFGVILTACQLASRRAIFLSIPTCYTVNRIRCPTRSGPSIASTLHRASGYNTSRGRGVNHQVYLQIKELMRSVFTFNI